MTGPVLRDATAADIPAIAALHVANWRDAYANVLDPAYLAGPIEADRLAAWTAKLTDSIAAQEVVVAEDGSGGIVGFACLYHANHPRWGGFVENLHSAAVVRGRGVGKALLQEAARRTVVRDPAAGMWLWVYESNTPARGFYTALGGEIVERVPSDWEPARGAMRLRCHWPSAASLAVR